MTSVTAFNDMMGQFLTELHKTFPEEKSLKKYIAAFELMSSTNPKLVVEGFMGAISPHMDKISAKDENFFIENAETIDFLKDINLKNLWPKASANTREAIWQYIQTLYMLGTTITSIPHTSDHLSRSPSVDSEIITLIFAVRFTQKYRNATRYYPVINSKSTVPCPSS